jgi:hypothetical protein
VAGEILSLIESCDFLWLLSNGGSSGFELGLSAPI